MKKDNLFFPEATKRFVASQVQGLVTTLTLNSNATESSVWAKSLEVGDILRVALNVLEPDNSSFAYINSLEWAFPTIKFKVIAIDNFTLKTLSEESYRENQTYANLNVNRVYHFTVEFTRFGSVQLWHEDSLIKMTTKKPKPKLDILNEFMKIKHYEQET